MSKEVVILVGTWILVTGMLIIFTPRQRIREATVIFLFKQFLTWFLGLIVVQLGLIEYPVRSFPNATKSSFDFEYYFYPAICVIFNLHYPEGKKKFTQFLHYFYYCSTMTVLEAVVEKYTNILNYIHWTWYDTWISLFITFFISRQFYRWYFRLGGKGAGRG